MGSALKHLSSDSSLHNGTTQCNDGSQCYFVKMR